MVVVLNEPNIGFVGTSSLDQLHHLGCRLHPGLLEKAAQHVPVSVRDGKVECAINGTTVGSYDASDVVADGRLETTDGVFGIRFGHNTEATVAGLTVTQN